MLSDRGSKNTSPAPAGFFGASSANLARRTISGWCLGNFTGWCEMRTKHAAGMNLSPQKYAELVGRSPLRMPTALGKPVWRCSAAELQWLEAWHLERRRAAVRSPPTASFEVA